MSHIELGQWEKVSPLLDELLELGAGERAARLDALRAQDAQLAAHVEAVLGAAPSVDSLDFLGGSADAQHKEPSLFGMRIGAYTIESRLGQGGSGTVWKARRTDGRFDGSVAIKLLHLSLVGRNGALRFDREGAILSRLSHPQIARMLDAGVTAAGQPYLVLELVDGEPIDQYCDARRLTIEQRLGLFDDVLEAVAHAHSHLIVHRDIKPTNILVTASGGVRLLDFGIAKMIQDTADETNVTETGRPVLTPEYAAPEQVQGKPVTTATDVYALGVLLYRLLAGCHPTAPDNARSAQVLRAALDVAPRPMASALTPGRSGDLDGSPQVAASRSTTLPQLRARLRGDLENIVARALRKDPAERYQTVSSLAEDLRSHLAHKPITARPDSLGYRCAKFARRHRSMVAVGMVLTLALAGGLIGTVSQARRAQAEALKAQYERDNAVNDLAFANAARDLLKFLVTQGNAQPLTGTDLLTRAEKLVDQQFAGDALTRGRLQLMLGIEYGNVLEAEKSKAVLLRAQDSARASGNKALMGNVDCLLAATLGDQDEPQRAMTMFDLAIQRLRVEVDPDRSVLAGCLHMRADLHAHQGQPRAMLDDALAAQSELGTPREGQQVLADSIRMTAAEAYGRLGQTSKAIAAYETSLSDMARTGWNQTARMALRLSNFSRLLYAAGLPQRAHEAAARGLQILRGTGDATELQAVLEGNDARALAELGRFDEAKSLAEHALASALERDDLRWAGLFALYGAPSWCATGDLARCASLLSMAHDKLRATLPPGHVALAVLEMEQARWSLSSGQLIVARERLQHALTLFDAATEKSPLRIRSLTLLARAEVLLRETDAAATHSQLAVVEARAASSGLVNTAWVGHALVAQGLVQQSRGETAAARDSWRAARVALEASLGEAGTSVSELRGLLEGE